MTETYENNKVVKDNKDLQKNISLEHKNIISSKSIGTDYSYKHEIVWLNAMLFAILHGLGLWGLCLVVTGKAKMVTFLWQLILNLLFGQGITTGAHRLFAHKCFKAKLPLKLFLILMHTASGQNSLFVWVRDHRLHHRYSDTDADPHNSNRGFFFSHIGWLLTRKHPHVKELGRKIDMSDLQNDWMVMFQKRYYGPLYLIAAIMFPVLVPYLYFGESLWNSFLISYCLRYIIQLNGTWLVNSAAHLYGTRPYDKKLQPVESWMVSALTFGEGWHNYHHAFPWDYKAAELTNFLNVSARFIDLCAKLGLAYDLKTVPREMVLNRIVKTGDGTHYFLGNEEAKSQVTAFGPVHPFNITYNVTYPAPNTVLRESLPLYEEDVKIHTTRNNAARG